MSKGFIASSRVRIPPSPQFYSRKTLLMWGFLLICKHYHDFVKIPPKIGGRAIYMLLGFYITHRFVRIWVKLVEYLIKEKYKDILILCFFRYKEGGESFKGKNIIFSPPILKVLPQTFRNITSHLILKRPYI